MRTLPFVQLFFSRRTPKPAPQERASPAPTPECPSKRLSSISLLDVVRELGIDALGVLSAHLEAAECFGLARSTCRALREALNAGQTHVELKLSLRAPPAGFNSSSKPSSPLLSKPRCSSVDLVLRGRHLRYWEHGQAQAAGAEGQPSPLPEDLLAWPFEGLSLHRRQQVTRLQIQMEDFGLEYTQDAAPHLPRILARLGPLLPALTHLDITSCIMRMWEGWTATDSELYSTLASAFPNLTSLAVACERADLSLLAHHLGDRLEVLQLGAFQAADAYEPGQGAYRHLPRFARVRELVMADTEWDDMDWDASEDSYEDDDDDEGVDSVFSSDGEGGELWPGQALGWPPGWLAGYGEEGDGAGGGGDGQGDGAAGPGGAAGEGGGGVGEDAGGQQGAVGVQAAQQLEEAGWEQGGEAEGGAAGDGGGGAAAGIHAGLAGAGVAGGGGGDVGFWAHVAAANMPAAGLGNGGGAGAGGQVGGAAGGQQDGGPQDDAAEVPRPPPAIRFTSFLGSLPPSLEQLRFRHLTVNTCERPTGRICLRGLDVEVRDGRARAMRVTAGGGRGGGGTVGVRALRYLEGWVRRSRLGGDADPGDAARMASLEVDGVGEQDAYAMLDMARLEFMDRRFERVDIGRLRLFSGEAATTLSGITLLYRPQVVEIAGVQVRLRAQGAVSLREGEDGGRCEELHRQHLRQQKAQQQLLGGGQGGGGGGGGPAGEAAEGGGGLDLRRVAPGEVQEAALGPVRRALAAAAAGGAGAPLPAVAAAAAAAVTGVAERAAGQAAAKEVGSSSGGSGSGSGAAAAGGGLGLPGLAVVPAESRISSHRLVLLWGTFFTVLGEGQVLTAWLCKLKGSGANLVPSWRRDDEEPRFEFRSPAVRYLRIPADGEDGGEGAEEQSAYIVVECESPKMAAEVYAAAAAAAAEWPGGGLQAVRLAGASLEEAVLRLCVSRVGGCGAGRVG